MTNATTQPQRRRRVGARALAVLATTAAALTVWVLAGPVGGIDLTVQLARGPVPVGAVDVALAAAFAGGAGWALLAVLERFGRRAWTVWLLTALVVLAVSLFGPLGSATTAAGATALTALHLAVAGVLIPMLHRSSAESSAAPSGDRVGSDDGAERVLAR